MTLCDQNSKSLLDKIEKNELKMLVKMHLNVHLNAFIKCISDFTGGVEKAVNYRNHSHPLFFDIFREIIKAPLYPPLLKCF